MINKNKRKIESDSKESIVKKKKPTTTTKSDKKPDKIEKTEKKVKFSKKVGVSSPKKGFKSTNVKTTNFKKGQANTNTQNVVTDWVAFKQKKKELAIKRKQSKGSYDVMVKAKKIGEEIRRKTLQGGEEERSKLIAKLHSELKGKGNYAKFVLTHDVGRVVQYLLKYGSKPIKAEITEELVPFTVSMLESKYGKFCVKRMLKYSNVEVRSSIIKVLYGHAVKLTSHTISAPVFEYAYSTFATPKERQHLIQEFFGDMFKQSKDDSIKHLRDTYKNSPEMKAATLGATKSNLTRVMNKDLYDSMLIHTVLSQYLTECTPGDRSQIITEIAPHAVVLSNSKDGARVVMNCMWHGTNKDRKVIVKAMKEHLIDLCKHEHGHCSVIGILDTMDDTVLLQKSIINEILAKAAELLQNEWGRKVLLWLVAAADSAHFHPQLIKELNAGRESSTCKKSVETRRSEILSGCISKLLNSISTDSNLWLSTPAIGIVTLTIFKTGHGKELRDAFEKICEVVVNPDWQIKEDESTVNGIEHAGFHMILKKLAQHDKVFKSKKECTFGEVLIGNLDDETMKVWIKCNRGCFLLVVLYENSTDSTRKLLKEKLTQLKKLLKKQKNAGSNILLKKLEE